MDIKAIIRQMLQKGMSEDEVIRNLEELGVENPRKLLDEVNTSLKPVKMGPKAQVQEPEEEPVKEQPSEEQQKADGESLFSDPNGGGSEPAQEQSNSLFSKNDSQEEQQEESSSDEQALNEFSAEQKQAEEMPQGFSFTTIDGKMRERKIHVDAKAKAIAEKAMRELQQLEKGISPEELDDKIRELEEAVAYLKKAFKEGTDGEGSSTRKTPAAHKAKPKAKKR